MASFETTWTSCSIAEGAANLTARPTRMAKVVSEQKNPVRHKSMKTARKKTRLKSPSAVPVTYGLFHRRSSASNIAGRGTRGQERGPMHVLD